MSTIDLQAYARRTGITTPLRPDLATLRSLAIAHVANIPFENLNPFLRVPVQLDLPAIEQKLVVDHRGGYCFEQNFLFREVLREVGFDVHGLIARVLWGRDEDAITAQTHMLLRVELPEGSYLVDVGYGSMALSGALALIPEEPQLTAHEPYRLIERDGEWRMQALVRDQWSTLYRFDLQPRYDIDYVLANHYTSTFPESHFLHTLIVTRTVPGRRHVLRNRDLGEHITGSETRRRTLQSVQELRDALESVFGIRLPQHPELDARLDALPYPEA
ncbi:MULTISPECIES: arylamine N-acetyltransferase family protein [Dyella]|uniref:Arylamine N-acetyltransferase n=2 Tax=Dyella TaxID=231454 RepID=A0A4R0Z2R8_9GAMM|nr:MULTISPECIES: arylamine N-acetyltransferase [Dyella]TBR38923.1 arylamine N-acetyltransferase [Dyella terrae]TCI13486.1 arylamine N-acetyltransferase [Dyella soli]